MWMYKATSFTLVGGGMWYHTIPYNYRSQTTEILVVISKTHLFQPYHKLGIVSLPYFLHSWDIAVR